MSRIVLPGDRLSLHLWWVQHDGQACRITVVTPEANATLCQLFFKKKIIKKCVQERSKKVVLCVSLEFGEIFIFLNQECFLFSAIFT